MSNDVRLSDGSPLHAQAAVLAGLVELEALWENLRHDRTRTPDVRTTAQDLHSIQKAYEGFRVKLAGYNKLYAPAHVPDLLLNTPARLGLWCRRMRDLFLRVENDPRVQYPVHLLEKAYGWADKVADKISKDRLPRPTPTETISAAIRELETLAEWCDELARVDTVSS